MVVFKMNNRIPDEVVEKVRKANDIVDVVENYVQLKKQGRNYFGLCPFHGEKTPSFSVTQDKQIYYCFGCKKGGNVISFLMELEGYSFYEALNFLAEKSGIDLSDAGIREPTSNVSEESQQLLSVYEWLTKLYQHILKYTEEGKQGYNYFQQRGITDESIQTFQLGYAPNIKNFTADFLTKKGFHQQLLVKAGLLGIQDDQTAYDRFSGRIIFPIRNHLGKIVAFGGRTITDEKPKYLNSSESDLFHKSRILYNFDLAKKHIRKANEVILLEGQMDVISAYQAEIGHVVATLGTALSESQAQLIRRYVDTAVICYDSDFAGLEASYRAALLLRTAGCHVKIANLPENMDPDQYIKTYGSEDFLNKIIKNSDTFINFYMRYIKRNYNLQIESDRITYIQEILKEIAKIESTVEREHYIRDLSNEFQLSMDSMLDEIHKIRQNAQFTEDKRAKNRYTNKASSKQLTNQLYPAFQNAERQLLAYMLQNKGIAERVQKDLAGNFNIEVHKIIATHLYAFYEEATAPDVSGYLDKLDDEQLKQLVIEISMISIREDIDEQEIRDLIKMIKNHAEENTSLHELYLQQKQAEQENDPIRAAQIAMQIIAIKKQFNNR